MKKRLLILCTLICLLLTSCAGVAEQAPAEDAIQDSAAQETVPEAGSSEAAPAEGFQPSGSPVTEETWAQLQALFADGEYWYAQVLTSEFQTPEEINLRELFYCGFPNMDNTLEAAEQAYLEDVWSYEWRLDIDRLPASQMDEVLQTYLGLSLEDTQGIGLEDLTYWADTDCYYHAHGDSNVIQVLPHSAYVQADGTICLYYSNGDFDSDAVAAPEWAATLRPTDGGYWIVSNQPVRAG